MYIVCSCLRTSFQHFSNITAFMPRFTHVMLHTLYVIFEKKIMDKKNLTNLLQFTKIFSLQDYLGCIVIVPHSCISHWRLLLVTTIITVAVYNDVITIIIA